MPRNGLFADDGRVRDLSIYARARMTAIELAATLLGNRVSAAEADINSLEGTVANEANARLAADTSEAAARTAAILVETNARAAAVLAEANARTAALALIKLPVGGVGSMTFSVGEAEQDVYVTFPAGSFAAAPIVVVTLREYAAIHGVTVMVENITSSGMTVGMNIVASANLPADRQLAFNWIAIPSA